MELIFKTTVILMLGLSMVLHAQPVKHKNGRDTENVIKHKPDSERAKQAESLVKVTTTPNFTYRYDIMKKGVIQHLDRDYTYDVIPEELNNALLLQGVHRPPKGTALEIELLKPATVYFFFHHKADGGYSKIFANLINWERCDYAPQYDTNNEGDGLKMIMYKMVAEKGIYKIPSTTEDGACFNIAFKQIKSPLKLTESHVKFDDTRITEWDKEFKIAEIKSKFDDKIQKAYFYKSKSNKPKPLIVSLHTWSGNYTQNDEIAQLCKSKDLNYIHPDFRGENWTKNACCSKLALSDIDESITFAIENLNIDTANIFVIGVSGGGYATLSTFMKSKHSIKKFSAWASISDLIAWYDQSIIRKADYAGHILKCTESEEGILSESTARQKSPVYWDTPLNKRSKSELSIYAGVYDGIQGSVPITHSINFYNKLLADLSVTDSSKYVSNNEKLKLLEYRKPLGDYGKIADRAICLKKTFKNIKLVIFNGNHEMLTEYAFNELIEE